METSKLKPFNLEAALRGEKVVYRNGKSPDQLLHADKADRENQRLLSVCEGEIYFHNDNGTYYERSTIDSHLDLFMAPKKTKAWINVYPSKDDEAQFYLSDGYKTKELADKFAHSVRIDCVEIEVEE